MLITIFSDQNIAKLSKKDRKALLISYRHSYKNSIWAEISPEISKWYEGDASKKWFKDARDFYLGCVESGSSEIVLSEDAKTGEIIAALFTINGSLFLERSDPESRNIIQNLLNGIGAEASKAVYVGELFVKPKYRGASGGLAIVRMTAELHALLAKRGVQHVMTWTLDRKENEMLEMYHKIGLQEMPEGRFANGIDVFKSDHQRYGHFTKSVDGPACYFYSTMDQMTDFLAKFRTSS